MRLLFFGSPAIAVPFLEECLRTGEHSVAAVVTQPDRPAGRGLRLRAPPVKEAALRLGLPVLQPDRPAAAAAELREARADLGVIVAYGRILKREVLDIPRLGLLNVHFSLLPKYRGAAPVQWALLHGERRTGVTLFWLDEGMDSGPVQRTAALDIGPDEDARALFPRLQSLGVAELGGALADVAAGRVRREPQAGESSLAPKVTAETARVDLGMSAAEVHNRVRALRAAPKAALVLAGPERVALLGTGLDDGDSGDGPPPPPGTILRVEREKGFLVQCRPGRLWIREVQPEGKKPLSGADFLNGRRLRAGDRLRPA
ncbi:MAG: methionyl-tRNA formyltransferase [Elusimicrobia bacterium GWA2_69_24]|nr:MAG: methionyl-tRNA formyltransferase [Elusimicrobia bacterium GWA2_69_24]HBL16537.1 methionyl-tRNA formyltransferase [Elusimicrobiota bacterium]